MRGEGDSTDRRILDIATEHVRRFGLKRTTVVGIAAEAGMTHANVYRYFPSKQALADQVTAEWLRAAELRLSDIVQAPDPADDKLERFITFLSRAYEDKLARDANIFAAFVDSIEQQRPGALRHHQRIRDLIGQIIDEGISTRVLPTVEPRRIASLIFDTLHRFLDPPSILAAGKRDTAKVAGTIDGRRDRITRLLIRGLATGRPP